MDPHEFFTSARVHIVAGKGGVGKSTLSAALGMAAAALGLDVLLIEIEGRGGLPGYFGRSAFGYQDVPLGPGLRGRTIRAEEALVDYLTADRLGRVARRMLDTGLVEVISRGAPGLGDLLVLGKIKQLERSAAADVIIVDAPASGHALTMLAAPRGLLDTVADGPIRTQAADVVQLLIDARRCQVLLVTVPEQTPLNELVETAFDLEDRLGLQLGPVLVNNVLPRPAPLPPLDLERPRPAAPEDVALLARLAPLLEQVAHSEARRFQRQQGHLARLATQLPLPQLTVARRSGDGLGATDLAGLAEELLAGLRALHRPSTAPAAPASSSTPPPTRSSPPTASPTAADSGTVSASPTVTRPLPVRTSAPVTGDTGDDPCSLDPAPRPAPSTGRRAGGSGIITSTVGRAEVIVCVGAGGVGKTSVAAAIGLEGAHQGRRTVVLTIDPARRLADALGLGQLAEPIHQVPGPWPGELHVTMLDAKDTFDRLVSRFATDEAQQREILANRFYRNISNALSGTQEYMAAERLYELHHSGRYDLIVLDTPPTRQALDFLDAPDRLTRFLDHRVYRLLAGGTSGRAGALAAQVGLGAVRTAGRVVGTAVLADAIAFFRAFRGMQDGFRERAENLRALLQGPPTSFVVVAAPQQETMVEAGLLLSQLLDQQLNVAALILNRVSPTVAPLEGTPVEGAATEAATEGADIDGLAQRLIGHPWQYALGGLAQLVATRARQIAGGRQIADAAAAPGGASLPLVIVSELEEDVHDLHGVELLRSAIGTGDHTTRH